MQEHIPLNIIYRDEHIIAINKPSGLMVHKNRRVVRESRFALQEVRELVGHRVYTVHRLDRPTSGVLMFALTPGAARNLAKSFACHHVEKRYLAVVRGITDDHGVIEKPLTRDAYKKKQNTPLLPSRTTYRRLASIELPYPAGRYETSRYCLVSVRPETGRMHQIRRHFRHISHPLIGDKVYGDNRHNRLFRERFKCKRLQLAATGLALPHPVTGDLVALTAPLDKQFFGILRRFGWEEILPASLNREAASASGAGDIIR